MDQTIYTVTSHLPAGSVDREIYRGSSLETARATAVAQVELDAIAQGPFGRYVALERVYMDANNHVIEAEAMEIGGN